MKNSAHEKKQILKNTVPFPSGRNIGSITNSPAGPSWTADDNERYGRRPPPTTKSWTAGYWPWWTNAQQRRRRAALLAADWRRHPARDSPGTPIKNRYSFLPRKRCTHLHAPCTHTRSRLARGSLIFTGSSCASSLDSSTLTATNPFPLFNIFPLFASF